MTTTEGELTPVLAPGRLSNDDLAPTTAGQATWRTWDIFCLWMTSAHSLGSYGFAVGMLALGLTGHARAVHRGAGAMGRK
jgi:NCS1 family nucleobase:cation symporter-1